MPNTKEKTGSFKIPMNDAIMKAIKGGGAVAAFLAVSWFYTEFMKPDIQEVKNEVKTLESTVKENEFTVRQMVPDVNELKTDMKIVQKDMSEIKGDIKVILSKVGER